MFRNLIKLFILIGVMVGGAFGLRWYDANHSDAARIQQLEQDKARLIAQVEHKDQYIQRLNTEYRRAEVLVLGQKKNPAGVVESTTLLFVEYGPDGQKLPRSPITLRGDGAHFDALVINFDPKFIEANDALRGKSIALFYRVFGENQAPADGYILDPIGQIPQVYRSSTNRDAEVAKLEETLWTNVWKLQEDEFKKSQGVRSVSPESPWVKTFDPDKLYLLTLRTSGGLTIAPHPIDDEWLKYRDALRASIVAPN